MSKKCKIVLASKSERRIEFMKKEGYDFVIMPSNFEIEINNKKYTDDLLKQCVQGKLEDVKNRIFNNITNETLYNNIKNNNAGNDILINNTKENMYNADIFDNKMDENIIIKKMDRNNFYIVAADTVVVLNDIIIGKPKDRLDAIRILSSLSGNIHFVATGVEVMHITNITDNKDNKNNIGSINNEANIKNVKNKLSNDIHDMIINNNYIIDDNFEIEKSYVTFRKLTKEDIEEYLDKRNPYDKAGAYGIQDPEFNFDIKINGPLDNVIGLPMNIVRKFIPMPHI